VNKNGLKPERPYYDALTFTLGSGDESMKYAGVNTLEGIKMIKKELREFLRYSAFQIYHSA